MRTLNQIIFLLIFLTLPANCYAEKVQESPKTRSNKFYYKQFQDIFERVQRDYVNDPDEQKMTDEAINAMLQALDPYSGYYTDEDLDFFLDHTEGQFGGIGVEIVPEQGLVKVISPIDGLSAYKAGIKAGDLIIGVNGQLVSNLGFNTAVREIRGKPGTKLNLLVISEDENKPREVELEREIVKIKPIKSELELDDLGGIGYLRIVTFNSNTAADLKNAVTDLVKQAKDKNTDIKGIILDVRNNPGGLLDQAVAVSEYFIDSGIIVTVKGKNPANNSVISAGRFTTKAPKVPLVVLINSGSASASEILAGALQDHQRAIIMGTTSFGKGVVQTFDQINKRAGVKITTAKYYTPSGRSINSKGIEPDIFIESAKVEFAKEEEEKKSFSQSSIKQYLEKYDSVDNKEKQDKKKEDKDKQQKNEKNLHKMSEKYKLDYQYARAYDLIRGLMIMEKNNKK